MKKRNLRHFQTFDRIQYFLLHTLCVRKSKKHNKKITHTEKNHVRKNSVFLFFCLFHSVPKAQKKTTTTIIYSKSSSHFRFVAFSVSSQSLERSIFSFNSIFSFSFVSLNYAFFLDFFSEYACSLTFFVVVSLLIFIS